MVLSLCQQPRGLRLAVLNKVDLVADKTDLLPQLKQLGELNFFEAIIPVCALKNEGVEDLRQAVFEGLPLAPHFFAEDDVTDQSERHMVEEIVREKLMRQVGDEIPHNAAVVVEKFDVEENRTTIYADIYLERDSQKRIVIGKQGARLKLIGTEARKDIEHLLDTKVTLNLWVRVKRGWSNDPKQMRRFGYQ